MKSNERSVASDMPDCIHGATAAVIGSPCGAARRTSHTRQFLETQRHPTPVTQRPVEREAFGVQRLRPRVGALTSGNHPQVAEGVGHPVDVTGRALQRETFLESRSSQVVLALQDGQFAQVQQGDADAVGVCRAGEKVEALLQEAARCREVAFVPRHEPQVVQRGRDTGRVPELAPERQALSVPYPGSREVSLAVDERTGDAQGPRPQVRWRAAGPR